MSPHPSISGPLCMSMLLPYPLSEILICISQVEGRFYVNKHLEELMLEELKQFSTARGVGGFLPAVKQIANVAALPGIVGVCVWPAYSDREQLSHCV